ncbi:MAG TPA: BON domain-containing protein [Thermoanaerobaculia bacterium]|nr:BON domain-containing protein [Thermoanaerobaculia bacterium]
MKNVKTRSIPLALLLLLLAGLAVGCKAREQASDTTAAGDGQVRVEHGRVGADLQDAGITAKVKARLATDSRVGALKIDVDTKAGVVTLSGSVDAPVAKQAAVEIARGTDGVKDVVDRLTVQGT